MKMNLPPILLLAVLIACTATHVRSDANDHRYNKGDAVPLYANKVGPFHNPSETYRYFDLPFCSAGDVKEKREALGEVLNGDRLVSAPYKLEFAAPYACALTVSDDVPKSQSGPAACNC